MPVDPNSPQSNKRTNNSPPILRAQIEEAQRHTNSNQAAARWLGVSYKRYRQYAQLYGLFEGHLNVKGIGIEKGFSKRPTSIPLKDILAGKHPDYSLAKLKNRLIARKKIAEQCSLCGFKERRITDKKIPLITAFKDHNRKNFNLTNLHLLCYNCMFLTTGAPSVVYRNTIERSLTAPETILKGTSPDMTSADYYDPIDIDAIDNIDASILSAEEIKTLLQEIQEENEEGS